jgi:uncharacterized protein
VSLRAPDPLLPASRRAGAAAGVRSALFTGLVRHSRTRPVANRFRYGIYFLYLDLDELDQLGRSLRLFSHNGRALLTLRDADHGAHDGSGLRPWIDRILAQADIGLPGGRVMLLTFPHSLGSSFFPVSFWYCFDESGSARAVLAEVNNTFHQHHGYLIHDHGAPLRWDAEYRADKVFHVSPFIGMDATYLFRFGEPGTRLTASILDQVHDGAEGPPLLAAGIEVNRKPLTDANLAAAYLRYGPMSARATLLIRYQAVRLLAKGVKYLPKAGLPPEEISL